VAEQEGPGEPAGNEPREGSNESAGEDVASPFDEEDGAAAAPPSTTEAGDNSGADQGQAGAGGIDATPAIPVAPLRQPAVPPEPTGAIAAAHEVGPTTAVEARLEAARRPWHLALTGGANLLFVDQPSYVYVGSDELAAGEVALEAEWRWRERLTTAFFVGYAGSDLTQTLFQDFDVDTRLHSLQLGLLVGYRVWDWFMPYVRGTVAVTWSDLQLYSAALTMDGTAQAVGGGATAGLEVSVPRRWMARGFRTAQFTVGMRIEAGYLFLGQFDYATELDGDHLAESTALDLGTIDLQGAALRLNVVASF
jgi:hypothetical protein